MYQVGAGRILKGMSKLTNKDWWFGKTEAQQEARASRQEKLDARRAKLERARPASGTIHRAASAFDADFEDYKIRGDRLKKGILNGWPLAGARAEFEHGANLGGRITATRLIATGPFALALRKNVNKVYVVVELATGEQVLIESKAKNERQAREFANRITRAGTHFAA